MKIKDKYYVIKKNGKYEIVASSSPPDKYKEECASYKEAEDWIKYYQSFDNMI